MYNENEIQLWVMAECINDNDRLKYCNKKKIQKTYQNTTTSGLSFVGPLALFVLIKQDI